MPMATQADLDPILSVDFDADLKELAEAEGLQVRGCAWARGGGPSEADIWFAGCSCVGSRRRCSSNVLYKRCFCCACVRLTQTNACSPALTMLPIMPCPAVWLPGCSCPCGGGGTAQGSRSN